MLVNFNEMLADAKKHHYTVGAFNVLNMETMRAVITACEQAQVPVIAQVYHAHLEYATAQVIAAMGRTMAEQASIPVCISLDHGQNFEQAKKCIDNGFTGVMIDLATSDYDKNVEQTRKVVELAHSKNISVEAELGKIFDANLPLEVRNSGMTDPDVAARFVKDTGVDALAVSIGTAHGFYSSKPQIDFDRLQEIIDKVPCPIVVHGGSNTPDEDVKRMVEMGICKLNVGTDLMAAFEFGMKSAMKDEFVDIQKVLQAGIDNEVKTVLHKISLLTHARV